MYASTSVTSSLETCNLGGIPVAWYQSLSLLHHHHQALFPLPADSPEPALLAWVAGHFCALRHQSQSPGEEVSLILCEGLDADPLGFVCSDDAFSLYLLSISSDDAHPARFHSLRAGMDSTPVDPPSLPPFICHTLLVSGLAARLQLLRG